MKSIFTSGWIIAYVLIGFAALCFIDGVFDKDLAFNGTVIDKNYQPESNTTGTGYHFGGGTSTSVIVTNSHESEKWIIIIRLNNGKVVSARCTPELYYQKKNGDKVSGHFSIGCISGLTWQTTADK